MIDWMFLFDTLMGYVQLFTSITFLGLIGLAAIGCFMSNKRLALNCGVLFIALYVVALIVENSLGVQVLAPEILGFLSRFF